MKQMRDIVEEVGCTRAEAEYWTRIVPKLKKPREQGRITWYDLDDLRIFKAMKLLTNLGFMPSAAARFVSDSEFRHGVVDGLSVLTGGMK